MYTPKNYLQNHCWRTAARLYLNNMHETTIYQISDGFIDTYVLLSSEIEDLSFRIINIEAATIIYIGTKSILP